MRNKKGFSIFTLDSIVAVSIIAVGIILVFFRISAFEPVQKPTLDAGQNFFTFISKVKMENAQIGIVPGVNPELLVIEQLGEFYHKGDVVAAVMLLNLLGDKIISPDLGVQINIDDPPVLIYGSEPPEDVTLLIPFRKIVYGSIGKGDFYSYVVEVLVWQK
ncbi:MAG: hypothetical protein U9R08_07260 [Nanoarchaeota archaeon]|nr:hypothetical protein [Nanoarchaeota archaeon]